MSGNKLVVNGHSWSRHWHSLLSLLVSPVGLAHSLGLPWSRMASIEEVRGFNLSDGSVHRATTLFWGSRCFEVHLNSRLHVSFGLTCGLLGQEHTT